MQDEPNADNLLTQTKFAGLIPRNKRHENTREFRDWNYVFSYKNLQNPKKFKAIYSDQFVDTLDVSILLSREYVI